MGNSLDKPITEKESSEGGGGGFGASKDEDSIKWGVSSMQGWRITMEDAHVASSIPSVEDVEDGSSIQLKDHFFFAVLDGHGGSMAANFGSRHLLPTLKQNPHFVMYARMWNRLYNDGDNDNSDDKNNGNKNNNNNQNKGSKRNNNGNKKKPRKNSRAEKRTHRDEREMITLLRTALEDALVELDRKFLREVIDQGLFCLDGKETLTTTSDKKETPQKTDDDREKENEQQSNHESDTKEDGGDGLWDVNLVLDGDEDEQADTENDHHIQLSGTTLTAVLLTPDLCLCANLGDSRAVMDSIPLSTDHKPALVEEEKRIQEAGGMVTFGRVEGELAVSRALGDFEFKNYPTNVFDMTIEELREIAQKLKVSSFPEVTIRHRKVPTDQILVIACDGIWDVLKNDECCQEIQTLFETEGESKVGLVTEEILDTCLFRGSRDNMTIIVVQFPAQRIGRGGGVLKRRSQRRANGK